MSKRKDPYVSKKPSKKVLLNTKPLIEPKMHFLFIVSQEHTPILTNDDNKLNNIQWMPT